MWSSLESPHLHFNRAWKHAHLQYLTCVQQSVSILVLSYLLLLILRVLLLFYSSSIEVSVPQTYCKRRRQYSVASLGMVTQHPSVVTCTHRGWKNHVGIDVVATAFAAQQCMTQAKELQGSRAGWRATRNTTCCLYYSQ